MEFSYLDDDRKVIDARKAFFDRHFGRMLVSRRTLAKYGMAAGRSDKYPDVAVFDLDPED